MVVMSNGITPGQIVLIDNKDAVRGYHNNNSDIFNKFTSLTSKSLIL